MMKVYGKMKDLCPYYQNYENSVHNKVWSVGDKNGYLSFMWMVDWFVPSFASYLSQPHTILTPNAGLNRDWMAKSGWDHTSAVDHLHSQLPMLWNSTVDNTSQLIYRFTTESCSGDYKIFNNIIANYSKSHAEPRKTVLDIASSTM